MQSLDENQKPTTDAAEELVISTPESSQQQEQQQEVQAISIVQAQTAVQRDLTNAARQVFVHFFDEQGNARPLDQKRSNTCTVTLTFVRAVFECQDRRIETEEEGCQQQQQQIRELTCLHFALHPYIRRPRVLAQDLYEEFFTKLQQLMPSSSRIQRWHYEVYESEDLNATVE